MKRILVTGAKGFIGAHCLTALAGRGFEVHAISSRGLWNRDSGEIEWHHVDLHNAEHVIRLVHGLRPQYLLHLAWDVSRGLYWRSPGNLRWVKSSLGLLQAFIESGGTRLLTAGSCAEYDWRYGFCSEGLTPLKPGSLYGTCKDALQKMTASACREAGISNAWGRLFFIFGPGEHENRLVPSVITALLNGKEALCAHGELFRDYLYVKDVAGALVALLESEAEGPVNIASGQLIKLKELVAAAAEACGRPEILRLGVLKPPADEPPLLAADTYRLTDEVGWRPSYTLQQGMRETVEWWRQKLA